MTAPINLLLVTADQWRADCLGVAGASWAQTPRLDALAAEATLFLAHHGQATPCGPARASLFTGTYAFNHRSIANGTPLDAGLTNLALEARAAGYDPVLFGYTDTSADPRRLPSGDPRLRTYEGVLPGFRPELLLLEDAAPWLDHLARHGHGRMSVEEAYDRPLGAPAPWAAADSETAFLSEAFLRWLDRQPVDRPWFAHIALIKPHPPFVASEPWATLIDPAAVPSPVRARSIEAEAQLHPWLAAVLERPPSVLPHLPSGLDEPTVRQLRRVYLGLIAEVDHHLGRIVDALGRRGDHGRTMLVVTSDHGEMLGDHWLLGKAGFFPQAFHVPLLIRDPRHPAGHGRRVGAFTEHVDLLPTILEAIGREPPAQADGRSLRPWLEGRLPDRWRDAVHYEHDFAELETGWHERRLGLPASACGIAVRRTRDHGYVHFAGLPALLFDQRADPNWLDNLAVSSASTAALARESAALLSFRMRQADRRLAGALLSPAGILGRYDPLPPAIR